MRVLVVARTRMGGGRVCVGGLEMESGASLRLLRRDGTNVLESKLIRPGEIWDLAYAPADGLRPPHVEDVVVTAGRKLDAVANVREAILNLVQPWSCSLDEIFDARLVVTANGTAFVRDEPPYPTCTTGFWITATAISLSKFDEYGKRYQFTTGTRIRSAKYVGMDEPIASIPVGSLVRFSLSRPWTFPSEVGETGCWLQVSGWYL